MKITDSASKQTLQGRLRRVEGQLRGVQDMIERDVDCAQIATQLSACRSALGQALGVFATCAIGECQSGPKARGKKSDEDITRLLKLIM